MKMQHPTILAFDTATNQSSVALLCDANIASYILDTEPGKQAERLVPYIETVLTKSGVAYGDLTAVATSIGPGSFTGIRICLATGRAIAMAAGIPCIGISTLEAIAVATVNNHAPASEILVTLNAGKGHVYAQLFSATAEALDKPYMVLPQHAIALAKGKSVCITGNAATLLAPLIQKIDTNIVTDCQTPDARYLALIAAKRNISADIPPPAALYIRPPDAALHVKGKIK